MATEKYGVYAKLLSSIATTPVDTSTNIVFVGAAHIDHVDDWDDKNLINEPILITSMAEFETKLGGADQAGEGHANLIDAAKAAFEIAGISKCWMINVFDPDDDDDISNLTNADYVGTAGAQTGIYAVQKLFTSHGAIPNVVCCPGKTDSTIVAAIKAVVEKCNGHWDGIGVYDVTQSANQVSGGIAVISNVTKQTNAENLIAVWPSVMAIDGAEVSGSAVVAALYGRNDALQTGNVPVRTIGNTSLSIQSICTNSTKCALTEADATQLSADGIVTFLNHGGGNYSTWGDHTSAMSSGAISDERGRYDSNMRVLYYLTNRFQQKYRFSVDKPMSLTMRNDIIQEENDHLEYLRSIGALIGKAQCEFREASNPSDNIALGQFVWNIEATVTPPMKYAELDVAFSQAGYSVYYE